MNGADGPPRGAHIIVGLVGAAGTDLDAVAAVLEEAFGSFSYGCRRVRLSSLLDELDLGVEVEHTPLERQIDTHMDAGNALRRRLKRGDAMALLAVGAIRNERRALIGRPDELPSRTAFLVRSLKHPDELETLRRIYGKRFVAISAYSPHESRLARLADDMAVSHNSMRPDDFLAEAQRLIRRDEAEEDDPFGQNVRHTFPEADFFVDTRDRKRVRDDVNRIVELLFQHPFHTPTPDEFGMFHAHAARLRSAELGRQVGAAVCLPSGEVVAVGTNEVPRAGGGLYWTGDPRDARDFQLGYDSSDMHKRLVVGEILEKLREQRWLTHEWADATAGDLFALIEDTRIGALIEFGRAVHAEMAAITDASRRGVSVAGCTLFTTTFPCHLCAKHVVASGIARVVYVAPYAKSLSEHLHGDALVRDPERAREDLLVLEPFVGVAPRMYGELFTMRKRKDDDGKAVSHDRALATPAVDEEPRQVILRERRSLQFVRHLLRESRIISRQRTLNEDLKLHGGGSG